MENIKKAEYKKLLKKSAEKIKIKTEACYVGSDPTRVKMLFLLKYNKELCTSDLADILGISDSAISHQKAILEKYGLIDSVRTGQNICCRLNKNKIIDDILDGIIINF